jgi:hypothetical protein
MSIDVHDPVVATRKAARRARRRAVKTVETARAVDLHDPADTARRVARRAAKRAAKEARVAAKRATRRQAKRARRRLRRVAFGALLIGATIGVIAVLVQRSRGGASAPPVSPTFEPPTFEDAFEDPAVSLHDGSAAPPIRTASGEPPR